MSKVRNTFVFGLCIVTIVSYTLLVFFNRDSDTNSQSNQTQPDSTTDEKDLSKLLSTDQNPKIVKCNFTGTYQVNQDFILSKNGAKCNDFETRQIPYDNVISPCSGFLDPHQELFLNCDYTNNPVRSCDAVTSVKVEGGVAACEYWLKIKKID